MSALTSSAALGPNEAFERLGQITRQLHEAMTELGLDQSLHAITQEIPDARDRLSHVGHMTETAANKVLNLIDEGKPQCRDFKLDSQAMTSAIGELRNYTGTCSEEVTDVLANCQMFGLEAEQFADTQNALLSEIMMTQDFQDLSGQIIKKVIDIITRTEMQLVQLLIDSSPEQIAAAPKTQEGVAITVDNHVLEGPQTADNALKQDDVDDLLASLGF